MKLMSSGVMSLLSVHGVFGVQEFWIKVIFSVIFCGAALFVILSPKDKFDAETKRWAFGALAIIAGVWIEF